MVPVRAKMVKFDPNQTMYQNWQSAYPLYFAWFQFAPEELKEQYRASGKSGEDRSAFLRVTMEKEVRMLVADVALIAFGIPTNPSLEDDPIRIPAAMFAADGSIIDWHNSKIEGLGRTFEAVRVCLPASGDDEIASGIGSSVQAAPAKRGPKKLDPLFTEAIEHLGKSDPHFADMSQEKQIIAIQAKVAELHPGRFSNGAQPGHTTIWRYIKRLKNPSH